MPTLSTCRAMLAHNSNVFLYNGKLTVTFSGASVDDAGGVTDGPAVANWTTALKSLSISRPVDNFAVNQYYVNQAIKAAINTTLF
jgi:hypothetical protein